MTTPINRHLPGLEPYVPGEQPVEPGWIKLNTNENPHPPAPEVSEVVRSFGPDCARLYPPPESPALRRAIAETLDWPAEGIMITNGSDEALRLVAHSYLNAGDAVGMLWPTYSYYPLLGAMFGATAKQSQVGRSGQWPAQFDLDGVRVFFLANPNPPYGTFYSAHIAEEVVASHSDVLFVIDEAYVEFAGDDCLSLLRRHENALIVRTFSKSHALAGLRVGFIMARPEQLRPLQIVRDSYNVNAISQLAGLAAWKAREYYQRRTAGIIETRETTARRLAQLGFDILPSGANFIFARHGEAARLFSELRERKILVRYFAPPPTHDGLRITIGLPEQMDALIAAVSRLCG
ncbi:aminotransferase class I/II-fold pyridoxal phosphate-dependent enzyme [Candidatus Sumerlaeota bacterium]|nr:aminotransferase class I/II-fold pyridoxal phosphate-dependent enzyme [Candidatus Sumerlaeota bacterium]